MLNAFSSNLNAVKLKIFPNHGRIFNSILSPDCSIELQKYLYLPLIFKRFQRLCQVQFALLLTLNLVIDTLFEKLTPETGLNLKNTLSIMPLRMMDFRQRLSSSLFFNAFSGDLHFDLLIIRLCQICLIIGQSFEKCTI